MKKSALILIILIAISSITFAKKSVIEVIRTRIENGNMNQKMVIGSSRIYALTGVSNFYRERGFLPAWVENDKPTKDVNDLIAAIEDVYDDGLVPSDYHLSRIKTLFFALQKETEPTMQLLGDFDIILTDAFLLLSSHMLVGKVNPENVDPQWKAVRREVNRNLSELLSSAINEGKIIETFVEIKPKQKGYSELKEQLKVYRNIEKKGGFIAVSLTVPLKAEEKQPGIKSLAQRMRQGGFFMNLTDPENYSLELQNAVKAFQVKHGLEADAVVGKESLELMNIKVEQRIEQIRINLERYRWMPETFGEDYLFVNIANFELQVIKGGKKDKVFRAVVGKPFRKTPVFSARLTYLVLNPTWTVPPTIMAQDVIPDVKKNPNYLKSKNMQVVDRTGKVVPASSIDWSTVSAKTFPYYVRQEPGASNALGAVKFMFPNPYSVYIHDTPSKDLFAKNDRAFSSGCVRIQNATGLAYYLLEGHPKWSPDQIEKVLKSQKEQTVNLVKTWPVHIIYLTTFFDEEINEVVFRRDVYDRNPALLQAINSTPPGIE